MLSVLAEVRTVLLRPRIATRHGLDEVAIDELLERIAENAMIWDPGAAAGSPAPDRGDDHLWALLATVAGGVLVTGDSLLLKSPPDGSSVVSPNAAMALWRPR